jgi:hypothetical protein
MLKKYKKPVRHFEEGDYIEDVSGGGYGNLNTSTNTYIDPASDPNTNPNISTDINSPVKRGDVFTNQTVMDPSAAISGLKKLVTDNKGWLATAGALTSAFGGGTNADKKTGYQGGIPALSASRSMIAAPPTKAQGYRPGAGGIDYGGDVSYALAPGQAPYANLSGTSGSSADANLTTIPANVATAVNNAVTGVNTNIKTDTSTLTQAQKDALAVDNWRKSLSPTQYLGAINQWIKDHPNLSTKELTDALTTFKVSQTDLQTALGQNKSLSAADIYALSHGQGLKEANALQTANINKWITDHPYATAKEISDAIKGSGVNTGDIKEALAGTKLSQAAQDALTSGKGLDKLYKDIVDYKATHTPAQVTAAQTQFKVSDADMAAAAKYAQDTKYTPTTQATVATNLVNNDKAVVADQKTVANNSVVNSGAVNNSVVNSGIVNSSDVASGGNSGAVNNVLTDVGSNVGSGAVNNAPTGGNAIFDYFASPAVQEALASGDTRGIAENMQNLGWSPSDVAAATGANLAEVQSAYDSALGIGREDTSYMQAAEGGYLGYAEGGMAKGRYLQGETDGMADKLPAQIGNDQPAALSHGEFVIPADVVSHMGNGNSDAGAKKLYQMMDKIRMARTGNKKQGKRINPDKFMPGGLAQAYANGGTVKKFAGETDSLVTANKNSNMGISGVESNLSNWAGPYVTNMLGQGQALANMPYQAYKGPLTAGASDLQNKVSQGLQGVKFPGNLGQSFASPMGGVNQQPPAFNPATMQSNLSGAPTATPNYGMGANQAPKTEADWDQYQSMASFTPGADMGKIKADFLAGGQGGMPSGNDDFVGQQRRFADTGQDYRTVTQEQIQQGEQRLKNAPQGIASLQTSQQPSNIAQSYMNPYLQSVLDPQLAELRRQNDITNMNTNARLAGQGAYGGGRQAVMNAANNRDLMTAMNKTVGEGYSNAYDKAMGQFNTEQGQSKTLVDMMSGQGAIDRGIEAEGVAADKAQFEEARANPYKMVQYQQSLLQGLPLAAQSYQGIEPSALLKASQGASTVNALLKNLGLA